MATQISRFDDGDLGNHLVCYYNPSDVPPTPADGSQITELPPGYAGVGESAFPRVGTVDSGTYTGNELVGAAKAIRFNSFSGNNVSGLSTTHTARLYNNGYTIVCVHLKRNLTAVGYTYSGGSEDASLIRANVSNVTQKDHWISANGLYKTNIPYLTTPTIQIVRHHLTDDDNDPQTLPIPGIGEVHIRDDNGDSVATFDPMNGMTDSDEYVIGGTIGTNYDVEVDVAIFAVYDKALTDGELDSVKDLCTYWINNGQAPDISYDTFTSFGPVVPNDLSATLTWEVWLDSDASENWQPYTVLSDASLSTDNTGQPSMPVDFNNVLNINSGRFTDSCQIRCTATTSYSSEGIVTKTDRLLVVGAF